MELSTTSLASNPPCRSRRSSPPSRSGGAHVRARPPLQGPGRAASSLSGGARCGAVGGGTPALRHHDPLPRACSPSARHRALHHGLRARGAGPSILSPRRHPGHFHIGVSTSPGCCTSSWHSPSPWSSQRWEGSSRSPRNTVRLVPPEDPEALADAIQRLLDDPVERMTPGRPSRTSRREPLLLGSDSRTHARALRRTAPADVGCITGNLARPRGARGGRRSSRPAGRGTLGRRVRRR